MKLQRYLKEWTTFDMLTKHMTYNFPKKDFDRLAGILKVMNKRCAKYIKELRMSVPHSDSGMVFLYRGSKERGKAYIHEITPRKNRRPKDMPPWLHEMLNDKFYNKFGWFPRSAGVFATASRNDAKSYGELYSFWPIGDYKYLYSDSIKDLYYWIGDDILDPNDMDSESFEEEYEDEYGGNSKNGYWEYDGENFGRSLGVAAKKVEELEGDETDLTWVPDKTFEEFMDEKRSTAADFVYDKVMDAVNSYRDNNLHTAIRSDVEIMFNCDSYYLINSIWDPILHSLMKEGQFQYELPDFGKVNLEW